MPWGQYVYLSGSWIRVLLCKWDGRLQCVQHQLQHELCLLYGFLGLTRWFVYLRWLNWLTYTIISSLIILTVILERVDEQSEVTLEFSVSRASLGDTSWFEHELRAGRIFKILAHQDRRDIFGRLRQIRDLVPGLSSFRSNMQYVAMVTQSLFPLLSSRPYGESIATDISKNVPPPKLVARGQGIARDRVSRSGLYKMSERCNDRSFFTLEVGKRITSFYVRKYVYLSFFGYDNVGG